jgi:hypothetical protein
MDNFPGTKIISQKLPQYNNNGGIDIAIEVNMTNKSPIALEMGKLALGIRVNESVLGQLYTPPNFVLLSGVNLFVLRGTLACCKTQVCEPILDNGTIVNRHRPCDAVENYVLETFFSNYIAGIPTAVVTNGLYVKPNVPWLSNAVKNIQIKVSFENKKTWPVDDLKVEKLKLYAGAHDWDSKSITALSASFALPQECGFSVNITDMQANLKVYNNADQIMGRMVPIEWNRALMMHQWIYVTMQSNMVIDPIARAPFGEFLKSCLTEDKLDISISGSMNAKVNMFVQNTVGRGMGRLNINNVDIIQPVKLRGMNNFRSRPVLVGALELIEGTSEGLKFSSTADMFNAGKTNTNVLKVLMVPNIGSVEVEVSEPSYFNIMYQAINGSKSELVGHLTIPKLILNMGMNKVKVKGLVLPPSTGEQGWARREFLSGYTTGMLCVLRS